MKTIDVQALGEIRDPLGSDLVSLKVISECSNIGLRIVQRDLRKLRDFGLTEFRECVGEGYINQEQLKVFRVLRHLRKSHRGEALDVQFKHVYLRVGIENYLESFVSPPVAN